MTVIIISLLLLVSLLPILTFTAHVRIVTGSEAKAHSRPYMISVQLDDKHICGGFLISEEFALTAASCWKQGDILTVVVGAHKLNDRESLHRFKVKSYIKHPGYTSDPVRNDIMLLKLQEKVKLNDKIKLISLPKDGKRVKADTLCSVAGWGDLWTDGGATDRLRETNTVIVNDAECKRRWGSVYVASKMICVYGHGGSCNGDTGGPLVCDNTAVGVTSFGDPYLCNSRLFPNVYTEISAYLQWIHCIIEKM